ncbi:PA2169 family four-helix-bundle protein [Hymenobacter sp. BT770]|uniref:PA2169 family four-helix-bundle protein n=1 Tax=Hymenobacter sp. BT770 TaxID=2886942 RepID=UPI001D122B2A|nr:PA2169 family four-helix-bundle protein [Hymenobacter sp. BT770]MCC3153520.1 PA2169 family four-helix-bundle protein [Hymenobacter sp. BT770]MDO3415757.1 PA2169 family four-helix-bundle protein [Hymenobacter sp. BT770]
MEAKATQALLNELVETLKDGQKGYADAMTDVEDPKLKDTFKKYAAQRAGYITEIEDQMFKLDLKPDESSSLTGTVHRAWIDLKSALTSKDNKAVLNECERGEDYAIKAYQTALKAQDLPTPLKSVIEKQYQGVQEAHNTIRTLRDTAK